MASNPSTRSLQLALGADHGGFELKEQLKTYLREKGYAVRDLGTNSKEPVDYPKIAQEVARMVASGAVRFGIMIDGAGIGSAMTANKIPGVLAAAAYNEALARNSREHNDANVLTLGAGQVDVETAKRIVDVFLTTDCTADRHRKRVRMIRDLEKGNRDVNPGSTKDLIAGGHRADRRPPLLVERANVRVIQGQRRFVRSARLSDRDLSNRPVMTLSCSVGGVFSLLTATKCWPSGETS